VPQGETEPGKTGRLGRGSAGGQGNRRHTEMCGYRCFLPDLTGFAAFRCDGPDRRRTLGGASGRSRGSDRAEI